MNVYLDIWTHWGQDKMAAISQKTISLHFLECIWISTNTSLKFVPKGPMNNIPSLFQIMAWRRPDGKPLSETMMASLPTHICITRPPPSIVPSMVYLSEWWACGGKLTHGQMIVRDSFLFKPANRLFSRHLNSTRLDYAYIHQWTASAHFLTHSKCITLTSQWARWRLKSPASALFIQLFIHVQIKENIKAPRHWPLCGEFTGDRWILRTKGQ